MKLPSCKRRPTPTCAMFASALLLALPLADSANALDPRPRTYRERAKHDFRDVQLGLCHPADGTGKSKSVKCSDAHRQFEAQGSSNKK